MASRMASQVHPRASSSGRVSRRWVARYRTVSSELLSRGTWNPKMSFTCGAHPGERFCWRERALGKTGANIEPDIVFRSRIIPVRK